MSKLILFDVATPQILQVDNKLEEDSFQSPEQFQINTTNNSIDFLKQVKAQRITKIKDESQTNQLLSPSQGMKSYKSSSSQLLNVQMTNQSEQSMLNSILQCKMEEEIRNYFHICCKKVQHVYFQFEKRLATQSAHKIQKQIRRGIINISEKSVNLDLKSKEDKVNLNDLRRELQKKKQQAIKKIKDIEAEKLNLIVKNKKKSTTSKEIKRDVLTEEQKQKLVELVKQKRQFEKSVNNKNQQLIEQAKMRKLRDEKERQTMFLKQNQKKKIKILQSLKLLQLKSKQRQQLLKKSILKAKHIYTHKKYQNDQKQQQRLLEKQQKDVLQCIHKKFQFSIADIDQHQKRYSLQIRRRQEQNKKNQSRISQSLPKRQKTSFDRIVQSQMNSIRQKYQQQRLKLKEQRVKQKIAQYQEIIDKKYKPKLDTSNSLVMPLRRTYSSVSLSKDKRVKIGLEYLAKAKQLNRREQKREKPVQTKIITGYSAYKDYLKDRQPTNYNISKRQFSQLIRRPKQCYEQLQMAKNMTQGLEAKYKKNPDSKLYQSMKNKLLLLDSLY